MSDDSRADRLRRRRREQRSQQSERDNTPEPSDPINKEQISKSATVAESSESNEYAETSEEAEQSDTSKPMSVKDAQIGTYMYLPESLRSELDFRYKELNLAYERSFGDELEKNRHFYPLVVQAGLNALDKMDSEDVRDLLLKIE